MPWVRRAATLMLAGALVVISAAVLRFGPQVYYRMMPPRDHGHPIGDAEAAAFAEAAELLAARIIWSSNRSGNHEIYLLELGKGKPRLRKLTEDPHVDSFPRFSPVGTKIVFNRSRQPWVSERDPEPWDVWIMNADGGEPHRIAEHGFHASFTADGHEVIFARGGRVVRHALDDGREQVVLDAEQAVGGWGQEPELRDQRLAVTLRGGRQRAFGVYDLAGRQFAKFPGDGCEIGWWPGEERVVWVDGGQGNGGTRIAWGSPDGKSAQALIDLPGKYSHEYYPRLSRDGKWLVGGASSGGHEPGVADYEIFLWKVGEPWDKAHRLTYHTGNDEWPDLWPD